MESLLRRILPSFAVVFLPGFQLLLVIPFLLYTANADEFAGGPLNLLEHIILRGVPAAIGAALVINLLPSIIFRYAAAFLTGIGICLYLQSSFFIWKVGQFDGKEIDWTQYNALVWRDYVVWGLILAGCVVFSKRVAKSVIPVTALITAIQCVNIAAAAFSYSGTWKTSRELKGLDEFYRFSPEKNVVFVVLDTFEAPTFWRIMRKEPKYAGIFRDFTFFKNTLSPFPTTLPSIPAVLSGVAYDNVRTLKEYFNDVLPRSLPSLLHEQGYQVDLATMTRYCSGIKASTCTSLHAAAAADVSGPEKAEAAKLFDVVLFRSAPGTLKRWIYNDQSWRLQRRFSKRKGPSVHVTTLEFVDSLKRHARVKPGPPSFKFFHLMIPHLPVRLDPECNYSTEYHRVTQRDFGAQSQCALRLAEDVLNVLKRLGVYDQSDIFIFGDHGFFLRYFKIENTRANIFKALPLLLVKKAGRKGAALEVSTAPAMLTDLPATVTSFPHGRSLWSLKPNERRERHFFNYHWKNDNWNASHLPPLKDYTIQGDAWDGKAWTTSSLSGPEE